MPQQSINPSTGAVLHEYKSHRDDEVRALIEAADQRYQSWRLRSFTERAGLMHKAAEILRRDEDKLAVLMAEEMGKVLREGRAEVEKCAWVCDYYADNAQRFLQREPVELDGIKAFVSYRPIGAVLAVMPWNFPLWQVFRFAAPALMAGNVGLLKHASNVPACALAIEELFRDAGFPENAFTTLLISSKQVKAVIEHKAVKAVTLTGSSQAGQSVAATAGHALKKTVLELGGSDPYLILADANIDEAASICAASRMINAGQSCIAAKRFIVVDEVREAFEHALVSRMSALKMGDPRDEEMNIGPQAREDLRHFLHEQVQQSIKQGAKVLLGCNVPEMTGAYYPPSVLTDVGPGMLAFDDELFGPVAAIVPARDEAHAIELANNSVFGLGAAVFTHDRQRGERIAEERLEAGACFVNGFVRSDPRLPFGGIKTSGYGRELSHQGIREFVNVKTVVVA